MTIGYNKSNYPEQRNIINKVNGIVYIKARNYKLILINIINKISKFLLNKDCFSSALYSFYFYDFGLNKVDIIHLFNDISFGNTPWITTFETILPRYKVSHSLLYSQNIYNSDLIKDTVLLKTLNALAGKSCKQIIAISQCNLNMQKKFLLHFPEYYNKIEPKLVCLHPPQKQIVNSWKDKSITINGLIHFMFVGGQFFGKGGREILEVFKELRKIKNFNFKLTIISSLTPDTYASNTSEIDVISVKGIIDENKEWIDYFKYLPNPEVLDLMKTAHVGLLPTYADTYGYSVLEFQASGCPVISTNVRALPEINNDEIGWMIPVRKHSTDEGYYATLSEREEMSNTIKLGLEKAIIEIMNNKLLIKEKSNRVLKHIKENHSTKKFSMKLEEIYREVLK